MELKRKTLDEAARSEAGGKDERSRQKDASGAQARDKPNESASTSGGTRSGGKVETPARSPVQGSQGSAREAYGDESADDTHPGKGILGRYRRLTRFRKVLLLSAASCLLLGSAGFPLFKFIFPSGTFLNGSQKLEPLTSIMRPIPQPDYREMLDFLLVYESRGQKMITAIRVEIGYQSPTRYQNFKEQNVTFRDTVYAFMLRQNQSGNSVKNWHSVLEKDLLDFLNVKLPQSYPDKIVLTQVENL